MDIVNECISCAIDCAASAQMNHWNILVDDIMGESRMRHAKHSEKIENLSLLLFSLEGTTQIAVTLSFFQRFEQTIILILTSVQLKCSERKLEI